MTITKAEKISMIAVISVAVITIGMVAIPEYLDSQPTNKVFITTVTSATKDLNVVVVTIKVSYTTTEHSWKHDQSFIESSIFIVTHDVTAKYNSMELQPDTLGRKIEDAIWTKLSNYHSFIQNIKVIDLEYKT